MARGGPGRAAAATRARRPPPTPTARRRGGAAQLHSVPAPIVAAHTRGEAAAFAAGVVKRTFFKRNCASISSVCTRLRAFSSPAEKYALPLLDQSIVRLRLRLSHGVDKYEKSRIAINSIRVEGLAAWRVQQWVWNYLRGHP